MSVYYKENPSFLRTSMESIYQQTVPTDDFVLICDGPLTDDLASVINSMQSKFGKVLHVIRLEKNQGLGNALRIGVNACRNELIARMDSDDISRPDRCEKELSFLSAHPEISIVGGWIEEFITVPEQIESVRAVPETSDRILEFAKKRNPFNHPSVMYRKKDVLAVGNYPDTQYIQDYYLWIFMLMAGFKGHNLQEPLVWMRADSNLFKRRSGKTYRKTQIELFKYMKDQKFITNRQYVKSCTLRSVSSIAPNPLRRFVFKKVLRK